MMHGAFNMDIPLFINKLACSPLAILLLVPFTRKGLRVLSVLVLIPSCLDFVS